MHIPEIASSLKTLFVLRTIISIGLIGAGVAVLPIGNQERCYWQLNNPRLQLSLMNFCPTNRSHLLTTRQAQRYSPAATKRPFQFPSRIDRY